MPANLENSVVATGLEKVSFHSNTKKCNAKECSNYYMIALIAHASKVMLKSLQTRLQQYLCTKNLQLYKLDLEKAEEPEVILPISAGSQRKKEFQKTKQTNKQKKQKTSALLTTLKFLNVWITKNWKILKEMGLSDYFTCLLKKLYASQRNSQK